MPKPLAELRAELASVLDEGDTLVARMERLENEGKSIKGRADAAQRELTVDEQRRINAIYREFTDLDVQLRELCRDRDSIAEQERRHDPAQSAGRVVAPTPIAGAANEESIGSSPKFYAMFPGASRRGATPQTFRNLGEFARAVHVRDPRLFSNSSGASEGVGADGGFYVPPQFYAGLMDDSLQDEAIRPGATIIPMTSSSVDIPMFDLSNRSTGIATMEGKLTGEGVTGTTQKAKVRSVSLTAKKIQVLVPATMELLQDAPQVFQTLLQQRMTDALGQTLDTWFISGDGAGAPLGIMNAPCLVTQAKDSGQVAATITPTNIANMVSRLAPGSWRRATWIVSPSALSALFTMKTVVTNVAGTENVGGFGPQWFQSNADGTFALLGRPLIVSDRCAALGTVGDIMLVDLRSYLVGIRQDATLDVSTQIGFKESEIWFRLNCRIDGQPSLQSAITPRVGSTTLSPFVTLQAR